MAHLKASIVILITVILSILLASCSGSAKSQAPIEPNVQIPDLPSSFGNDATSGRSVLAVYDAVIDPIAEKFTVTPSQRTTDYHFPLSQYFPNVLEITGYGFTPNFWADIKLTHPYPGSGINGFDPRVIAILPARAGVNFIYPSLGVEGNNKALYDPDGYTKLFDNLGGSIPGNTNPFKAYFKSQPYRIWSPTGVTSETQRWNMNLAGFGGSVLYKLVVDVSTNFPNLPAPIVDNAPEPVRIDATVGQGLTKLGGSADITATLLDWQGRTSIGGVKVEAPDLFNGTVSLAYSDPGPNPHEYVYTGTIGNSLLASEGEHKILVAAWDQATEIYIYNEFTASVSYLAPEGSLIWAKRAGAPGTDFRDYGYAITTLSDNSTVVTGRFWGSATFGPGEPNQTILTSAGYYDIFIARYNLNGRLLGAKRAGGSANDEGYGITTLSDNSIVVTGYFRGTAIFGLGDPNQTVLISDGYWDMFIARYNPNGTLAWAKCAIGEDYEYGRAITTLSDNSTVVTGAFSGLATFGPGESNHTILVSAGAYDTFIARYNPDGTLAWAKRAGGSSNDEGYGITTLSDNSTVVTGYFIGSATFGLGEPNQTVLISDAYHDIFIARYNPNGTLAWAKRAGGASSDFGYGITTLSFNSTVVIGYFHRSATFGSGEPNQTILTSAGSYDIFIARYNPDGTLSWAKHAGGTSYDYIYGITALSGNSTVMTGYFRGSATFGPGEPNQTILTAASEGDIFIARYNPDGTISWAKRAGGSSDYDCGYGITTLSDNSTVVTGWFARSATFGPGEPNQTILTAAGWTDIFIARFEP